MKGKYSSKVFFKSSLRLKFSDIKKKKRLIKHIEFLYRHFSIFIYIISRYASIIRSNGSYNYFRRISWLDWQGRRRNSYGHCPRSYCSSSRGFVGSRRRSRLVWRKGSPLFSDNRGWFVNCRADWRKEAPVQGIRHLATPSIDWIALEIVTVLSFSRRRRMI